MRVDTELKAPLDGNMFKQMCDRVRNLEQENAYLKYQLDMLREEKKCEFHISKEPQLIDVDRITPLIRLGAYCTVEDHGHRKHVIAKMLSNDVITFAYYISEQEFKHMSLEHGMCILGELHKNLIQEMIKRVLEA